MEAGDTQKKINTRIKFSNRKKKKGKNVGKAKNCISTLLVEFDVKRNNFL